MKLLVGFAVALFTSLNVNYEIAEYLNGEMEELKGNFNFFGDEKNI